MKKTFALFSMSLLISFTGIAQNSAQPELDSGTIENQFDYIITKSSSFKDFQLIRKASILKVKAHTLDSLKNIRVELNNVSQSIAPLQSNIQQLEAEVATLKQEIETINKDKDSMNVFGLSLTKTAYNSFMWSLVVVLVLGLLFFMMQYKNHFSTAKRSKNELVKVEEELESYRKKALKKEQELMRKLQDELNKNNP